jgi:5'-nucleotidase
MAWAPEDSLVIGISSRALFNLDREDEIYRADGLQAYIDYQCQHEDEPVEKGVAFPLISALLGLNVTLSCEGKPAIEVVIVSKNHPACAIRIRKSLQHYGLPIRRAVFTGGADPLPHLKSFKVGLFLSREEAAVSAALSAGLSSGLIHGGPEVPQELNGTPIIAFDGDSVLFSDQSDQVYRQSKLPGLRAFEKEKAKESLPPGPLHRFAMALERLRENYPIDAPPFRIALVTAREIEFCERPIRTLREWGIRLDHATFCADMSKAVELAALRPLIFFDDNLKNCVDASNCSPTVRVPISNEEIAINSDIVQRERPDRSEKFLGVCRIFLKKTFDQHSDTLRIWHDQNLSGLGGERFEEFTDELQRSATGTPGGRQRRAAGAKNEDLPKLMLFLENALRKYRN